MVGERNKGAVVYPFVRWQADDSDFSEVCDHIGQDLQSFEEFRRDTKKTQSTEKPQNSGYPVKDAIEWRAQS